MEHEKAMNQGLCLDACVNIARSMGDYASLGIREDYKEVIDLLSAALELMTNHLDKDSYEIFDYDCRTTAKRLNDLAAKIREGKEKFMETRKGFDVASGYMGYVKEANRYMLFASESEYDEYLEDHEEEGA